MAQKCVLMVTAKTPTNMSVIKYWGKRDEKLILAMNESISVTFDPAHLCTTTVAVSPGFDCDRMWLNGKEMSLSGSRYQNCLREIRARASDVEDETKGIKIAKKDWENLRVHISSYNNFPTAAGLAYSASGFASLVFALAKLMNIQEENGKLSAIARQGSGSACRSLHGGFVKWVMGKEEDGSDSIAVQLVDEKHWDDLVIIIAVVSSKQKEISSRFGMVQTFETSTLMEYRAKEVVPKRVIEMEEAIKNRDFPTFARLTCAENNQFHAICLDTSPPIFYMNDTSHRIISCVEKWNRAAGTPQRVDKLGEGFLDRPEDVVVDKMGIFYTATRDGWIKRRHKNGTWESWKYIGRDSLLGLEVSSAGHIIVCDTVEGLLKVSEDGVTVLASHVNGEKIRFADDVVEASDGNVYFSSASKKFGQDDWYLDVLEAKPHGQLLVYNPSSNHTYVLIDNLAFANGVALSADQDYLIVCETWKYRCLKYWLKGEIKGQTEIFIKNLPGAPDNIKLAPDGSFWIALIELSAQGRNFVHKSRVTKHLLATFPKLINWVHGAYNKAMVVNVGTNGKIIKGFDDPIGKVMTLVTSALEYENRLYLGSLNCDFIGVLSLTTSVA